MSDPGIFATYAPEGYEWVLPVTDDGYTVTRALDGTPRSDSWQALPVKSIVPREGATAASANLPWMGSQTIVLNEVAMEVLEAPLSQCGELLPLSISGRSLWAFNTTVVVDLLDLERSEIVWLEPGKRIMTVREYRLLEGSQPPDGVFKLFRHTRGPILVSHEIVELCERHHLSGTGFARVWSG